MLIKRNEIAEGFRAFMNDAPHKDPRITAYGTDHDQVIAQVFLLVKKSAGIIGNMDGTKHRLEFSFPIARVLQVGDKWRGCGYKSGVNTDGTTWEEQKLKAGDFVRLKDNDAKTILNPSWEAWNLQTNAVKDGNMEPLGEAPPMYWCNMRTAFGRRAFNPDPFNLDGSLDAFGVDIFFLDQAHILMPIEKPEVLLDAFLKDLVPQHKN